MRTLAPPPPPQHRRATALAVALLLHAALAMLLIFSVFQPQRPPVMEEETILYLTPARAPVPPAPPAQASAPTQAPRPAAPPPVLTYDFIPPARDNAPVFAAPRNDIERLVHSCAADRVARMTPEDRARCRFAFGEVPRTDPTAGPREKLRDEATFAAERAAAQTPLRVPCVSVFSRAIGGGSGAQEQGVMADPFCALDQLRKLAE